MSTLVVAYIAAVITALIAAALAWPVMIDGRGRRSSARTPGRRSQSAPVADRAFPELRDTLGHASQLITEASSTIKGFQADIETHVAKSWERENVLRERYEQLVLDLILLLDHFETLLKSDKASREIQWMSDRTRRILEDRDIEEIPVGRGDLFDGARHKQVTSRPDALPKGSVLEVVRKGYREKDNGGGEHGVLRPAEVAVSRGPLGERQQLGPSQEVHK